MSNTRTFRTTVVTAAAILLTACGSSEERGEARRSDPAANEVVITSGLSTMAFDSLRDWVSYADLVAVASVDTEREGADRTAPIDPSTALIPRDVTVSIEEVVWSRRGEAPEQMSFRTDGWLLRDGERVAVADAEGPRLEVGQQYLIAFIVDEDPAPMTASSILPLAGHTIQVGERATAPARALGGITLGELARRLETTDPDPLSLKYEHLPAEERYGRTQADREAAERDPRKPD